MDDEVDGGMSERELLNGILITLLRMRDYTAALLLKEDPQKAQHIANLHDAHDLLLELPMYNPGGDKDD